ncbi:MAG: substrate-binding domain-containing protein, partial [Candidatus Humimicrobiaceae bacterium]
DFNTTSSVLKYCKTSNVKIPEEIALIGFEFEKFCANAYVPLTAIKYDTDKISEAVWSILSKLIDSNNSVKTVKNISTKPELVIRESCGELK